MMIINWLMVFCLMHSASSQSVDLKIVPEAKGTAVVQASINAITEAEIFPVSDEQMLRRIAYTETNDGNDPNTYPADYHGGIWKLSEEKYTFTKQVHQILLDKILMTLDINWPETSWMDLRKPLWSALAARLYLHYIGSIPLSVNHNEQAMYWFNNYRTSIKKVSDYINSIANLTLNEACKMSGMDLFFLLDESGSIGSTNYQIMKMFVNQWIDGLDIGENDVRVGLMTFDNSPRVHFNLHKYYSKANMKQGVKNIGYRDGGTDIAFALTITRNAFTTGGRPSSAGIPRVIVVVTHGKSIDFDATRRAATKLHNEGFIVFAIGISGADENELNAIASRPSYVAFIDAFDPVRLQELQVNANDALCREIPLNETVRIFEGETKYLNYHLSSSTSGITIQADVHSGAIILYASSTTEKPNEADHDVKLEIRDEMFKDIFIDTSKLEKPIVERIFPSVSNYWNSTFAIWAAKLADFIVDRVIVFIPEVRPSFSKIKGSVITLSCIAGGKPTPSIDWLKDGVKLLPSQNIAMDFYSESNITTSELIISYLDVDDSGTYECLGYHTVPDYGLVNASSLVVTLNITSASLFTEPSRGNMLGGTLIRTRGVFFRNIQASVECSFDGIRIPGVIVNETEAVCVSPRFDQAGSKPFLLYIDGRVVRSSIVNFYATHYADSADVNVSPTSSAQFSPGSLLVDSFQHVMITWNEELLLSSFSDMDQVKISIQVLEACVLADGTLIWEEVTPQKLIFSNTNADITSSANGRLPQFSMLCNQLQQRVGSPPQLTSPYSLVLLKVIVDPDKSQHEVIKKLQMLLSSNVIGIWSHVLIREYARTPHSGTDILSQLWNMSPSIYHPVMFNNITLCPCTKSQADKDGSFEESSNGEKVIDNFLYGPGDVICYDEEQNSGHEMNGFQEYCYRNSTELLLTGDRAGSANVYTSNDWEKHFIYDIAPFIRFAEMNKLDEYYSKRPKNACAGYKETKLGRTERSD